MLTAIPKSLLSWNYSLYESGAPIAELDMRWFREEGSFSLGQQRYRVYRKSRFPGVFVIESQGDVLCRAVKPSMFFRAFELRCGGRVLTLRALSPLTRSFGLYEDRQRIGTIKPLHFLTLKARIELPEEIALPVRVFMFWLALILWRRAANAAAAS